MVLIFQPLADLWRSRLEVLDRRAAGGPYDAWRLNIERRVLRFLLQRHADAPASAPPRTAEPLDRESAAAAEQVYLSDEARSQLQLSLPAAAAHERQRMALEARRQTGVDAALARFDAEQARRQAYAQRLNKRSNLCVLAFLLFVAFLLGFYLALWFSGRL